MTRTFGTLLDIVAAIRSEPKNILVIGDIMLDVYTIGEATRISPEAPVPVLLNPVTEYRLGGAGAVAAMVAALECHANLIGDVGNHPQIFETMRTTPGSIGYLCTSRNKTTVKHRICALSSGKHRQQIARIDEEDWRVIDSDYLRDEITTCLGISDAILVSDYRKGICTPRTMTMFGQSERKIMFVDPARNADWCDHQNVACLVPNRIEAAEMAESPEHLRHLYQTEAVVVKKDSEGCEVSSDEWNGSIPATSATCLDVTGAGDQFIATLAIARTIGATWADSARLANIAAGLQVQRYGATPVTLDELEAAVLAYEYSARQ